MADEADVADSMGGRVVLITGATQGIGRAAALGLGRLGARLCLVARDEGKARAVADRIAAEGGEAPTVLVADLSSVAEVKRVAASFRERFDRLDVLVNNAGAIFPTRKMTSEGNEATFALNHLAYFTLTCELRRLLLSSRPSRVVNVASSMHNRARVDFADLHGEKSYGMMRAYGQSKLANILFTYELARRLAGTGVTVNCLHPGVVRTGFGLGEPGFLHFLVKISQPLMISEEKGAETIVYLASSPEVEGVTGGYFVRCRKRSSAKASYDADVARRLWEESERLTGSCWD